MSEETYVYITDLSGIVYKQKFSDDETLVFIQENDTITLYYEENPDTGIREIEKWEAAKPEEQQTGQTAQKESVKEQ